MSAGGGTMRRVCMGLVERACGVELGTLPVPLEQDGQVSHGLCAVCAREMERQLHREHMASLALACEYTFDIGGAGHAPRAATPVPQGPAPHEQAVPINAAGREAEAPERPGVVFF